MKNLFDKTQVKNSFHGWKAETLTEVNGIQWEITTMKRYNGFLTSTAQKVNVISEDILEFSFGDTNIKLISEKVRVIEKAVKEQHAKALILFDENEQVKTEGEKADKNIIEIGQRVFVDSLTSNEYTGNRIIYDIEVTKWGTYYKTVDTKTFELGTAQHVRPYSEKFGIGTYFNPGDVFKGSLDELNNIVIEAKQKEKKEQERRESEQLLREQVRNGKIEEGKKLVSIPEGAKAVIVAEMYEDDSDSMTDYFSTSVKETIILAFSFSTKNNMNELKKACLNFEQTKEFAQGGKELEHTTGHSYLPDYYLGSERWFGWKVNKSKYRINLTTEEGRNELYIAATEGRYFVPKEDPKTTQENKEKVSFSGVEILEYSEKAIAVIGDTKPIKDQLKELGGKFNFRLSCGAGWIFSKTKRSDLENLLSGLV